MGYVALGTADRVAGYLFLFTIGRILHACGSGVTYFAHRVRLGDLLRYGWCGGRSTSGGLGRRSLWEIAYTPSRIGDISAPRAIGRPTRAGMGSSYRRRHDNSDQRDLQVPAGRGTGAERGTGSAAAHPPVLSEPSRSSSWHRSIRPGSTTEVCALATNSRQWTRHASGLMQGSVSV